MFNDDLNLSFWHNFNQFKYNSKDYQLFTLDSSWYKIHHKTLLDSNFVNQNIQTIDSVLGNELKTYRQFYTYKFYLLDTLRRAKEGAYLLLLEQYRTDPIINDFDALVMIIVSGNNVMASYHLAEYISSNGFTSVKSSVLLDGGRILSRTTEMGCSDSQDENGKSPCSHTNKTELYYFDSYYKQYRQISKKVGVGEGYTGY
jgi:hypothetical protein